MNKHTWILEVLDDIAAYSSQNKLYGVMELIVQARVQAKQEIVRASSRPRLVTDDHPLESEARQSIRWEGKPPIA